MVEWLKSWGPFALLIAVLAQIWLCAAGPQIIRVYEWIVCGWRGVGSAFRGDRVDGVFALPVCVYSDCLPTYLVACFVRLTVCLFVCFRCELDGLVYPAG